MTEIFKYHLDKSYGNVGLLIGPNGEELVLPLSVIVEYFEEGKQVDVDPMTLQEFLAHSSIDNVIKMN